MIEEPYGWLLILDRELRREEARQDLRRLNMGTIAAAAGFSPKHNQKVLHDTQRALERQMNG